MAPAMAAIIEMSPALLKSLSINFKGPRGETFFKICYKITFPRVIFLGLPQKRVVEAPSKDQIHMMQNTNFFLGLQMMNLKAFVLNS